MNKFSHYNMWVNAIDKFDKPDYQDWFRFAMLWFSFNSYYSERYMHIGRETDKITEFAKDNEHLYKDLKENDKEFKNVINEFMNTKEDDRKEVKDMRPRNARQRNRSAKFNSHQNSCEDFFTVLYQIRCNFFHGGKLPFYEEDKKLIQWAFKYFNIFWKRFLEQNRNKKIRTTNS